MVTLLNSQACGYRKIEDPGYLTLPATRISESYIKIENTFSDVFVVPQKVLWRPLRLHKTFWGATKKYENKNLS